MSFLFALLLTVDPFPFNEWTVAENRDSDVYGSCPWVVIHESGAWYRSTDKERAQVYANELNKRRLGGRWWVSMPVQKVMQLEAELFKAADSLTNNLACVNNAKETR